MFRLQPTIITITSQELSDSERRSRYRIHLVNRQKAIKEGHHPTQLDQEALIEHDLNTRIATPTTDSTAGQDTRPSPDENETGDEGETDPPASSLDYNTSNFHEPMLYVDVDGGTNHLPEQPEQYRHILRQRQSLYIDGDTDIRSLPIRTRPRNSVHEHPEPDVDDINTTHHILTAAVDASPRDSEEEFTDDQSRNSRELGDLPRDDRLSTPSIGQEPNSTTSRRHLPVYSDRLPVQQQPQTPRQLPEARHQSRFDGAYTAPVRGRRPRVVEGDGPVTVQRRRAGRNTSPAGLRTPGFQGLYGGSENAEDA
ncbi:hypothetical protein F53441_315 [Fusarium austroafricanum]|uniref:Uncharacterized protein n=1 Tax=Fusarium austroafricanum TaxID=2364996 RepID=A0A8H4KUR3_9HYPO|nr:hypothetical protein F53441_315 [Fusarium austroafricanum]